MVVYHTTTTTMRNECDDCEMIRCEGQGCEKLVYPNDSKRCKYHKGQLNQKTCKHPTCSTVIKSNEKTCFMHRNMDVKDCVTCAKRFEWNGGVQTCVSCRNIYFKHPCSGCGNQSPNGMTGHPECLISVS